MEYKILSTFENLDEYIEAVENSKPEIVQTVRVITLSDKFDVIEEFEDEKGVEEDITIELPPFVLNIHLSDKPTATICYGDICSPLGSQKGYRKIEAYLKRDLMPDEFLENVSYLESVRISVKWNDIMDFDIQETFTPEKKDYLSVGVLYGGKVVSYAHCYVMDDYAAVIFVHTHPKYRGKGLCGRVMNEVFRLFRKNGIHQVDLSNKAEEIGYRCYTRAAEKNGYKLDCKDETSQKYCVKMEFS